MANVLFVSQKDTFPKMSSHVKCGKKVAIKELVSKQKSVWTKLRNKIANLLRKYLFFTLSLFFVLD